MRRCYYQYRETQFMDHVDLQFYYCGQYDDGIAFSFVVYQYIRRL